MTYDQALEFEQEQRYEQSVAAEEDRTYYRQRQEQRKRPGSFGPGQLCTCGMMTAEDCPCHPF